VGDVIGYYPPGDGLQMYAFGGVAGGQVDPFPAGDGADDGFAVGTQWARPRQLLDQFGFGQTREDVHGPAQQLHPGRIGGLPVKFRAQIGRMLIIVPAPGAANA